MATAHSYCEFELHFHLLIILFFFFSYFWYFLTSRFALLLLMLMRTVWKCRCDWLCRLKLSMCWRRDKIDFQTKFVKISEWIMDRTIKWKVLNDVEYSNLFIYFLFVLAFGCFFLLTLLLSPCFVLFLLYLLVLFLSVNHNKTFILSNIIILLDLLLFRRFSSSSFSPVFLVCLCVSFSIRKHFLYVDKVRLVALNLRD